MTATFATPISSRSSATTAALLKASNRGLDGGSQGILTRTCSTPELCWSLRAKDLVFALVLTFKDFLGDDGAELSLLFTFISCNKAKSSGCVKLCSIGISSLYSLMSILVQIAPPSTDALNIAARSYALAASSSLKKKPR